MSTAASGEAPDSARASRHCSPTITLEAGIHGLTGPGINSLLVGYHVPSVPWWVHVASTFAVLAFFVLILENLTTLVGGSTALAIGIPPLLAVALLLGPVMARAGNGL
ncbi:hypothetical protein ACH4CE_33535 [Streptomyces gelaticus]|uniref:hypothetical protein n=1 Tax=Streptomyces gelaticus TaxID=285446 RepID=UPI0037BD069B